MLTDFQKKAIQKCGSNILVSAGAGTGKTRVLVERILYLLRTRKVSMSGLLVLTFTEKAANEIKKRLSDELRKAELEQPRRDLETAAISTFHSFAARLLREHPVESGVDPEFRVIETEQAELLKEEALRETVRKLYAEKNDSFELLARYGEETVKDGISKVFTAARHEGKSLAEFFQETEKKRERVCAGKEEALAREAQALISGLPEIDARGWEDFLKNRSWDWNTVSDFEAWSSAYKGKRKAGWKEWRETLGDLAALRMERLAAPWRERLERAAAEFEILYGAMKKEKGWLDFDDLQMKAVQLFCGERPPLQKLRERYQKQYRHILIDEFQDTNLLQVRFVELLASGDNLFMVGDYKQSIYGFRGAEPRIFLEKEQLYREGNGGERIPLAESFRSEPALLDFVNRFFRTLWEEDGFPFDFLTPRTEQAYQGDPVEVLVTELKDEEDLEHARMREAATIAARIRELHESDGVPYGSIAILFQAMTLSGLYEDALKAAGIPYFIVAGRGFYEQPEVRDMVSFLSHLERPLADIPLAATLRAPFFHVSDDTLFWMARYAKAKDEEAPLYRAVQDLDRIPEISGEQRDRLLFFIERVREFAMLKDRIPLSVLVDKILERTGYELSVLTDPSGVRRFANLKKLIALIREYEAHDRLPLAAFLGTLRRLELQEARESEAQIALESGAEAVRMMTVHAAKGLEFPVVLIADLGHQGTHADSKAILAHAADGYGLQVRNETSLKMEAPFFHRFINAEIQKREDEEWKRLLYVAMTRAKSRLFLSGVHEKRKTKKESFREMTRWMDWVMTICETLPVKSTVDADKEAGPLLRRGAAGKEKVEEILREISVGAVPQRAPAQEAPAAPSLSRTLDLPVSAFVLFQKEPREFWRTYQIGWTVRVQDSLEGPASTAPISAAQKLIGIGTAGEAERKDEELDPEGVPVSPADFGTAMHRFFEHVDFKEPERCLERDFLERIFGGFGKEATAEAGKFIRGFLESPVFRRLQKARRVERETDFVLNGRHGLIHGKIDVLFEDDEGGWHILDYKTATGDDAAARESAYDLQLEIYALAAHKILKIPVRSGIIYYLKNKKEVTLPFGSGKNGCFFEALEKKIFDLQEKILDYSNERIAGADRVS